MTQHPADPLRSTTVKARSEGAHTTSEEAMRALTDDQLNFEVRATFGAGGGATMEAIRRLRERLDTLTHSNHAYARSIYRLNMTLTIVSMILVVLTTVQIVAAWPIIKATLSQ
jgi:hypothetical protein